MKQPEADQIVKAMQEKKIPVTYVLYPDEGTASPGPRTGSHSTPSLTNFLSGCLGGRAEPIGDDAKGASLAVPNGAGNVPGLEDALASLPK